MNARGISAATRRVLQWLVFGAVPVIAFGWCVVLGVFGSEAVDWAFDFRQFWQGGKDVVNGVSPYPSDALLATAGDHLDPEGIQQVFRFPYPAGAAVALAPLGSLEFDIAASLWGAVLIVSLVVAVWLLGVRDWRVMGVVAGSPPVISAVCFGTLTPLMVLLAAVAWRWRDRGWITGCSVAVAIALKLFLWPLVVWLMATRRWVAAGIAAGLAVTATLAAWAAIGFDGFADYPRLLSRLADVVAERSFSLVALGVEIGLPQGAAELLPWAVGLFLLAAMLAVARDREGDMRAFSLVVVAAIALSPIVWAHYFALLVIPLALARPRLSWAWGLMWVFWLVPGQENQDDPWRILLVLALTAAVVGLSGSGRRRPIMG